MIGHIKSADQVSLTFFFLSFSLDGKQELDSRRHDIQHNDIQHNDIQHKSTQHNDIQHKSTQQNDIQNNDI
jgi:hypothetical protein